MPTPRPRIVDPHLALVFASAPAGLGHLRVTNALRHALPAEAEPLLLVHADESLRWIHRLTSTNPLGKRMFESAQQGRAEAIFTPLLRRFLRAHTRSLAKQLRFILAQRLDHPQTLLVVATHFGLAHKVAKMKKRFSEAEGVVVRLIVQVTDDSPQHIWYVDGADLIVVPSAETARALRAYGKQRGYSPVPIVVAPYPVSPLLTEVLPADEWKNRQKQLAPYDPTLLQIALPISGAAVGLYFAAAYSQHLSDRTRRVLIHCVVKNTPYTRAFRSQMESRSYVKIWQSTSDRQIVELYDDLYQQTVVGIEVTKPSEQAFKVLYAPREQGGAILLFTEPVGRQERDNLAFMERHHLIPTPAEHELLWQWARDELSLKSAAAARLLLQATTWRGLRLPLGSAAAAQFTLWAKDSGLFQTMIASHTTPSHTELGSNGAEEFWDNVCKILHKT